MMLSTDDSNADSESTNKCLWLVVSYTGAKKGSCFQFLRVPAYLMQYDLLSILTPFLLKSAKKWDSAVQKTKSDEGGLWGVLKMAIQTKYLILHHTMLILVLSCIFLWSKNRFVKVLKKSDHLYSWKRPFKSKLEKEGALRLTRACS